MQAFGLAARNDGRLPHPYDSKFAAHIAVLQFSHRNLARFRLFDGLWTMQSYLRWLECPVLQLQIKPYLRFLSSMQDLSIARTLSRSAIERKKTKSSRIWTRVKIPHESNRNDVPIPTARFRTTKSAIRSMSRFQQYGSLRLDLLPSIWISQATTRRILTSLSADNLLQKKSSTASNLSADQSRAQNART